ncbi:MAG: helix-hairpin-helix domain-containing protein [Planctomycetaceae bacterium]|jgi:competence ComEA-like helix-hairpin-helix protein|nr:helix-hairpin-helix domain-containing protein [Planctomycetaceae bacterium]
MVSQVPDNKNDRTSRTDNRKVAAESPSVEGSPTGFLWLTNRDQWLVVIVSVAVVILLVIKWQNLQYVNRSEIIVLRESEDIGYQIDLNLATWIELAQLRDVGPVTAQAIISNREEFGPFTSIDDLQRVKGIGPKTVEKNRRWLRVAPDVTSTDTESDR